MKELQAFLRVAVARAPVSLYVVAVLFGILVLIVSRIALDVYTPAGAVVAVVFAVVAFVAAAAYEEYAYRAEERLWNDGICAQTGCAWEFCISSPCWCYSYESWRRDDPEDICVATFTHFRPPSTLERLRAQPCQFSGGPSTMM